MIKRAEASKKLNELEEEKQRLELIKPEVLADNLGKMTVEQYVEALKTNNITVDEDITTNPDGSKTVITDNGYSVLIEQDGERNVIITIEGKVGETKPIIKKIEVSATSTSITGKATVSMLGKNGTVTYYYKLKSGDDSYTQITNIDEVTGATVNSGITAGEEYTIKVVAKNEVGEVSDTKDITATKVFVSSVTLNKQEETVALGKSITLTATIKPDDATNDNVKWESSNTAIATVNENGVVTGKTLGTVTITVKSMDGSDKTASCTVTVKEAATAIEINSVRARIATGYTRWLTATAEPTDASQEFDWTSSNTNVATVDGTGKITAKAIGVATITVKTKDGSNLSKTCKVTVANGVDITTLTSIQSSNQVARDSYGNLITVPGGFKVLTSEATNVTQGIVIQNNDGSEFVWVPVDSVSKGENERADDIRLGRYTDFKTQNASGNYVPTQDADKYTETIEGYCQETINGNGKNTPAKNLGDFVTKTQANGGYYFGRYEASYKSSTQCYSKKSTSIRTSKSTSLKSGMLWNYISQTDAAKIARSSFTSSYVESDLVNSYTWDTALIFIQKYSGKPNYANTSGGFMGSLRNTGTDDDKACNIQDAAGNCYEWTTEASGSSVEPFIVRGEYFSMTGEKYPYLRTAYDASTGLVSELSFRSILYVK